MECGQVGDVLHVRFDTELLECLFRVLFQRMASRATRAQYL
jgi:hypothetical protein